MTKTPISADGIALRRGSVVYEIYTQDAGKTWQMRQSKIAHTNQQGRITFNQYLTAWTSWSYCWYPPESNVGDHRIYSLQENAQAEVDRRNNATKTRRKKKVKV